MITMRFRIGGKIQVIQITGKELVFAELVGGMPKIATIEGLRLVPSEIVKKFPDLKGKPIEYIKKEAIRRFKEHLKSMKSEEEIMEYVRKELEPHGYQLLMYQKSGWRPVVVK